MSSRSRSGGSDIECQPPCDRDMIDAGRGDVASHRSCLERKAAGPWRHQRHVQPWSTTQRAGTFRRRGRDYELAPSS